MQGVQHALLVVGIGVVEMRALGFEDQQPPAVGGAAVEGHEIRPDALRLPAPQIPVSPLARRHPMPPPQGLPFVEIERETPLQGGIELITVDRFEEAQLRRLSVAPGEQAAPLGHGELVTLGEAEIGAPGLQVEADFLLSEFPRERAFRPFLHRGLDMLAQFVREERPAAVDRRVGVPRRAQALQQLPGDARRLPRVGDDVRQPPREP